MNKRTDLPVRCCRCRHKHNESERKGKPHKTDRAITISICPRCGAESYYNMTPFNAYCWANGLIQFGETIPEGAIAIASGPKADLKWIVESLARHGYKNGELLVPGVPEAADQREAGNALAAFLRWAAKSHDAKNFGIVFAQEVSHA